MVDDLWMESGDGGGDGLLVADVEPEHLGLAIDVGLAAGAEVVQDRDLVSRGDVSVRDMRADETGAASDENLHEGDSNRSGSRQGCARGRGAGLHPGRAHDGRDGARGGGQTPR